MPPDATSSWRANTRRAPARDLVGHGTGHRARCVERGDKPRRRERAFGQLGETFSDCTAYPFELIAADVAGDMAYTVGYEHTQASVNGKPRTYTLRVTQVYRREGGEWRVVHRHGDTLPSEPG